MEPSITNDLSDMNVGNSGFMDRSVFPLCRPGAISGSVNFFVVRDEVFKHYVRSGKDIDMFNDMDTLLEVFSVDDLISVFAFNEMIFGGLYKNGISGVYSYEFINFSGNRKSITENIYIGVTERKKELIQIYNNTESLPLSNDLSFTFHKVSDSIIKTPSIHPIDAKQINYLIVINDPTIGALKVRDNTLKFVSECLKVIYQYSSIENTASSVLYSTYLTLLKFKQDNVEYV